LFIQARFNPDPKMATTDYLEEVLGYHFRAKSVLDKALTAPGAEGDKEGTAAERVKYEGNRVLADSGRCVLPLLALRRNYSERNSENGMSWNSIMNFVLTACR
tara:strand:- start:1323 stop:1631 length:309 start_codon:yes stop_codon:yes gene_type:complete